MTSSCLVIVWYWSFSYASGLFHCMDWGSHTVCLVASDASLKTMNKSKCKHTRTDNLSTTKQSTTKLCVSWDISYCTMSFSQLVLSKNGLIYLPCLFQTILYIYGPRPETQYKCLNAFLNHAPRTSSNMYAKEKFLQIFSSQYIPAARRRAC